MFMPLSSSLLLLLPLVDYSAARWPQFVDGHCELGKFYCNHHLKPEDFPRWMRKYDRRDPANVYQCHESPSSPGNYTIEWVRHCEAQTPHENPDMFYRCLVHLGGRAGNCAGYLPDGILNLDSTSESGMSDDDSDDEDEGGGRKKKGKGNLKGTVGGVKGVLCSFANVCKN